MTFSSALTCTEKTLFETTTLEVKDGQAIPRLFCSCMCVLGGGGGGVPLQKFQFANLINSVDKCKDKFHFHTPGVP